MIRRTRATNATTDSLPDYRRVISRVLCRVYVATGGSVDRATDRNPAYMSARARLYVYPKLAFADKAYRAF